PTALVTGTFRGSSGGPETRAPEDESILDQPGDIWRHARSADGSDPDLGAGVRRLEHHAVAEVHRFVLTGVGAVEDQVAAPHLRGRNLAARVVLVARVVRQLDPHTRESIQDETRTVEADGGRSLIDAARRTVRVAATP